jgi:hypothetical protein
MSEINHHRLGQLIADAKATHDEDEIYGWIGVE